MKMLVLFFLWLLLPRAAFSKTIALSVGLLFTPAISNTQALLAPIDKSISTSISKYGNQEGDLIILSLSLEECAACSSFPLLAADLCARHFGQDLKYLVPYEEEMFLTMFEDKFDIDLTSGQSQLIVDERLYSSMQNGAKSRILIVDNKKVEYFGLMQDFLDDYQALLGKEELRNCNDTLKVELSDKQNPYLNQIVDFSDSCIVFFNGYANELYTVEYQHGKHQYFELTDEEYHRILGGFVDDKNFDTKENKKYLSKNRQDKLAVSSCFANNGKIYAFGILSYFLLDGTEGYDRVLIELNDEFDIQYHYRFPPEIMEKEQKFYVNPYKGVYGNAAAVREDTIYTKIYDPYLLEGDSLKPNDLTCNTASFLKAESGGGAVGFHAFGQSQLPEIEIEERRNYYSDWTHFFTHQGQVFLLDESTLQMSNVHTGASVPLANKASIPLPQLVHDVVSTANDQQIEIVYTVNSGEKNAQTFLLTYDVEYDLSTLHTLPEYPNAHWKFVGDCLVAVSWEGNKEFTIYKKSIEAYK